MSTEIPMEPTKSTTDGWETPLPRENLGDRAYCAIRDALMAGQLKPGEKLLLRPLSQKFGISATPMREALLKLVSKEALSLDGRGTAVVPRLTAAQLKEIHAIRMMLEGYAASQAAQSASAEQIDMLAGIHDRLADAQSKRDFASAVHLNTEFHLYLCQISQCAITLEIVEALWMRCGPILSHLYDDGLPFPETHPHTIVLDALREQDSKAARAAIERDIKYGGRVLYKAVA